MPGGLEPVEAYRILSRYLSEHKVVPNAIKTNNVGGPVPSTPNDLSGTALKDAAGNNIEGEKPFEGTATNDLP